MKKFLIIFTVIFALFAGLIGYKAVSDTSLYKNKTIISKIQGKVVTINTNKEIEELAINDELTANEIVITEKDSYVDIHFEDESLVRLKPDSKLAIKTLPNATDGIVNLKLLEGKALFNIRKGSEKIKFKVNTINSLIGVKGTEFSVDYNLNDMDTIVKVLEGEVQTLNKKHPDKVVDLKSGEKLDLPGLSEPQSPQPLSEEEKQEMADIKDIRSADVKNITGNIKENLVNIPTFLQNIMSKEGSEGGQDATMEEKTDAVEKMDEIRNEVKNLQLDVIDFAANHARLPKTIAELEIDENIKKDPWGNYYEILPNDQTLLIYSAGPDGRPGTTDDIKF